MVALRTQIVNIFWSMKTLLRLITLGVLSVAAHAQQEELLDPGKAFALSATSIRPDAIQITWDIAKDYYMYRDKYRVRRVEGAVTLGAIQIPPGTVKQDPLFGEVEVYTDTVYINVPVQRSSSAPLDVVIEAEGQGCNEPIGVCYPPLKHTVSLTLPGLSEGSGGTASLGDSSPAKTPPTSLASLRDLLGGAQQDEFLDPDDAFRLELGVLDADTLGATFTIADGYYLYQDKTKFESRTPGVTIGAYQLPPGKEKEDEFFGKSVVYYTGLDVTIPLVRELSEATTATFDVKYQGCADKGICYPPITKTVQLSVPGVDEARAAPSSPDGTGTIDALQSPSGEGADEGFWGYIVTAFFSGVLLTFTPCVLPMIPILSSIIAGQGQAITNKKGGVLATTYVLGTAVTYTVAGVLAGATGDQLQAYFQNIWAIGTISLILVLLALSMFGVYEIQMPSAIQSRLQHRTRSMQGGALSVVFVLGMISALIVGACVSPLLIVALGVAIVKGDPVLGGAIMFALSLGMGVFLIALGFGAGYLLPRAGAWMDRVKHAFGVLLLGVAIYLLGAVPEVPVLYLWAALFIVTAVFMGATQGLPEGANGWRYAFKGAGVFLLVWGVLALIGGMTGGRDVFRPIELGGLGLEQAGAARATTVEQRRLFTRVASVSELDAQLQQAKTLSKPVLLDYYADWCVDCVRMEKATFEDMRVNRALRDRFVLLQVDVTDPGDPDARAIKQRFGVFGPPALLFFAADGTERKDLRRYGYMSPNEFLRHIEGV